MCCGTTPFARLFGRGPRGPAETLDAAHADLAVSLKAHFTELANLLLRELARRVPTPHLALAGGCAHNSVWVGQIPAATAFRRVSVAPSAGDAGTAVGAAILAHGGRVGGHWALLGPLPDEAAAAPRAPAARARRRFADDAALIAWLATELAQGRIIGLCRGRMEFGPRALGSRSILADPRDPAMKTRLNARVKHRETFRPFAASVLL